MSRKLVPLSQIRSVCIACLRGYESFPVGAPVWCSSCGSEVRRLAEPVTGLEFDELSIPERGDLKLAGRRG
jgi:DNA-directed RNA polymerase subunit RPC12/RpoP